MAGDMAGGTAGDAPGDDELLTRSAEVPRPRTPMHQRRCTCIWSGPQARTIPDPFCPSAVLHVDDAARR
ncbi:hypothetical protein [Quadrisphaera sp. DSM 44207]|uniref:hypothetical protein n=1 Tax=Quadrisphaera sp. DSM 44207 TaxID=1881057 RepID=UPI00115FC9CE|nr:hypothetical protein [Quadrisphaera sp. DSM 44207]